MVRIRRIFCCWTIASLLLSAQSGAPAQADALIVKISGNWNVDSQRVTRDTRLHYGETVRLDPGAQGSIAVLYSTGEKRSCPDQDKPRCLDLVIQRPEQRERSLFQRVFSVLEDALSSDTRSVPGLTKSSSIPDGCAELDSGNLLLHTPGLPPESAAHEYTLQFRKLKTDGLLDAPIQPNLKWRPGTGMKAENIKPGLYRVNVLDSDSEPTGDYFLLLVYETGKNNHITEDFHSLVAVTDTWGAREQTAALEMRRLFLWQSAKTLGLEQVP